MTQHSEATFAIILQGLVITLTYFKLPTMRDFFIRVKLFSDFQSPSHFAQMKSLAPSCSVGIMVEQHGAHLAGYSAYSYDVGAPTSFTAT